MNQKERWAFLTLWGLLFMQFVFAAMMIYFIMNQGFDFDQSTRLLGMLSGSVAAQLIAFLAGYLFRGNGSSGD